MNEPIEVFYVHDEQGKTEMFEAHARHPQPVTEAADETFTELAVETYTQQQRIAKLKVLLGEAYDYIDQGMPGASNWVSRMNDAQLRG